MFLVEDGHTNITKKDSLEDELQWGEFDYVLTNPPMGTGSTYAETSNIKTRRYEIAFFMRILKLLKVGGEACIILPDGFFENPSLSKFRKTDVLSKCTIDAIISLPKFAFAPYTQEKTYALFITKKSGSRQSMQDKPIWMYIIDNDGYANSDKRFPTKRKDDDGRWLHDEISAWIDKDGEEHIGILEERWLKFDDSSTDGTQWINIKGKQVKRRKGGFINISDIDDNNYYNLLPEYHLRPYEPKYIEFEDLKTHVDGIKKSLLEELEKL